MSKPSSRPFDEVFPWQSVLVSGFLVFVSWFLDRACRRGTPRTDLDELSGLHYDDEERRAYDIDRPDPSATLVAQPRVTPFLSLGLVVLRYIRDVVPLAIGEGVFH